jgi:subtilisin-like proprotein convertase family protein
MCRAAWMRGTFSDVADAAIPDAAGTAAGTLARTVVVYGLATVDTDVEPRITIHHPKPGQLRVALTNPAGSEVLVYDGATAGNHDGDPYLVLEGPLGFSGDESVNGEWTLRVTDRTGGSVGRLVRWDLTLTSRWD